MANVERSGFTGLVAESDTAWIGLVEAGLERREQTCAGTP